MRRNLLIVLCALMPSVALADTTEKTASLESAEYESTVQQNFDDYRYYGQIDSRFFVEYSASLYSGARSKIKASYDNSFGVRVSEMTESNTRTVNNSGMFTFGVDFGGLQLAFAPAFSVTEANGIETSVKSLSLKLDVPVITGRTQPYFSAVMGIGGLTIDDIDIDNEIGFLYGIGGGIKYNINDKMFVKFGVLYQASEYDIDFNDYADVDYNIKLSSFSIVTGIGYRF